MKHIEKIVAIGILIYAVYFNLNLYRLEPTAKLDPNDNNFQYALVDRTNQIWDFADRICKTQWYSGIPVLRSLGEGGCHVAFLVDHWVPNWAQGYNLPFYYSHVPQIIIVGTYRIFSFFQQLTTRHTPLSLFTYYHWFIYLLLCLFPIPVFLALRVIRLPWLLAGAGALMATHISTDGLYGLDPPSFLWRGWGLSSQLFAMIWLPLSLAYAWRFFNESGSILHTSTFWYAVFFTVFTIMGHLGIGVMTLMSIGIIAVSQPVALLLSKYSWYEIRTCSKQAMIKLFFLSGTVLFFLSYWIIPTMLGNDYHNISYWDPVWKFNSYGWKETVIRFFNGDLFDFGRFQWLTVLTLIGAFTTLCIHKHESGSMKQEAGIKQHPYHTSCLALPAGRQAAGMAYFAFSLLFVFWLLLYFGRTTWGGIIDLIPSMKEFHLSRFIVGLHIAGIFLIPMGISWLSALGTDILLAFTTAKKDQVDPLIRSVVWTIVCGIILVIITPPVYQQTVTYNELNDKLIVQANANVAKDEKNIEELFAEIRTLPPARVFAGRGGGWGKDFEFAETEMFMYLSTFGIPTSLWLPETWSPNSDTEQYFSEDQEKDYDLYNLRYIAAPPSVKPQPFWKELKRNPLWVLYETPTSGYFTIGSRNMIVVSDKESFINLVHLWIHSATPKQKLYPELTFRKPLPEIMFKIPTIRMIDEVTYLTAQNAKQNIFAANPIYGGDAPAATLIGPEIVDSDMIFKTTVKSELGCKECIAVLKQTYHPNWRATVDGKPVKPIIVFPFHIGVPLATSGTHDVVVWYQPSTSKVVLLNLAFFVTIGLVGYSIYLRKTSLLHITRHITRVFHKKR